MKLLNTYLKPAKGSPMLNPDKLRLRSGYGIVGDTSWARNSPRQVLLASKRTYEELGLDDGDLRENLLVDGDIEDFYSGQVLRVGANALVRLTFLCEPCIKLNRIRPGLAKVISRRRGFLGRVIAGGEIRVGDEVALTDSTLSPIPDRPRDRVYDLVSRIPYGRTLGFKALVGTVGLPRTYVRVMPKFLRSAPDDVPVHRVITTDGALIPQHLPHQPRRLTAEGIILTAEGRVRKDHVWDSTEYFGYENIA